MGLKIADKFIDDAYESDRRLDEASKNYDQNKVYEGFLDIDLNQ